MDEIKQDGCRMSGWDELLWLYDPTRKISVPLQSIRTFLENGIYHCYCGGGKLHDAIALSEPPPTYLHGFALGEIALHCTMVKTSVQNIVLGLIG
jgi:hypothetical protein